MSISHERLVTVFDELDLEVTRARRGDVGDRVTDDDAIEVLTSVGIPERIGGHVTFHAFDEGVTTLAEFLGDSDSTMLGEFGDYVLLGSGSGIILLQGGTGEVYAWKEGNHSRISRSLRSFVEFMCVMQIAINEMERKVFLEEDVDPEHFSDRVLAELRGLDAEIVRQEEGYWRTMIENSFASLGFR